MGRHGKRAKVDDAELESSIVVGKWKQKDPVESEADALMTNKTHSWLKWPRCDTYRKIELNNKLDLLQNRAIYPPRIMDWNALVRLGVDKELELRMATQYAEDGNVFMQIPIWERAFGLEEDCYRKWMLEFYSRLVVEKKFKKHEIPSKKLIHFQLGGVEHHCTIAEIGLLTGLLTPAKVSGVKVGKYLAQRDLDSKEFLNRIDHYWYGLSGKEKHSSHASKVSKMRVPDLRVISKMLTYYFFHRAMQNDKVYAEDLWVLSYFDEGDVEKYVNVLWALVCIWRRRVPVNRVTSKCVVGISLLGLVGVWACTLPQTPDSVLRQCNINISRNMIWKPVSYWTPVGQR